MRLSRRALAIVSVGLVGSFLSACTHRPGTAVPSGAGTPGIVSAQKGLGEDSRYAGLKDKDPRVRWNTLRGLEGLAKAKDPRTVELLIATLGDKDEHVRREAASGLERTNDYRAVEPLIAAMTARKENGIVRVEAAESLGKIGDARAVEPLIGVLREHSRSSHAPDFAAKSLGEIGDYRAVEPLIEGLASPDSDIRTESLDALKKITGQDFGRNPKAWSDWWEENKTKFIPSEP